MSLKEKKNKIFKDQKINGFVRIVCENKEEGKKFKIIKQILFKKDLKNS